MLDSLIIKFKGQGTDINDSVDSQANLKALDNQFKNNKDVKKIYLFS